MTAKDDGVLGVEKLRSPIKMILSLAGNALINQHSDINRTAAILRDTGKCEFILVSDVFMTPSARFADILLPATSFLETPNIAYPVMEGDYLLHNNPLVPPLFECRFEYDWLKELARSLGWYREFTQGYETVDGWLQYAYKKCAETVKELPPYEQFRRDGGYFYHEPTRFVAFREQIETLEQHPFPTASGKIEIFSKQLYDLGRDDIPGLPSYVPGFENSSDPLAEIYPFQLIGWHTKRRNHSIHDNNLWMERIETHAAVINTRDAEALGIREGELVEIWNARGRIRLPARVTNDILRGVIAVSQGAWFTLDTDGADIRGNINTLTTQRPTPLAKGNPQHSNLVDMRPG
jgi:anaerobic dimethyl sulfoxide reductase subunit A